MSRERNTKAQKRSTAASRTAERRLERERSRRRQRLIMIGLVIAAVVVIVAIPLILANQPEELAAIRPAGGVDFTGTLVRLHIGLEHVDDLLADLDAGFARLTR